MRTDRIIIFLLLFVLAGTLKIFAQSGDIAKVTDWKYQTGGKIHATPVVYDNVLYIGSFDSCFYALDAATGNLKWKYKTDEKVYTRAVKYDNILIFESGNILYGLTLEGELAWKFTLYDGAVLNQHDEWDYYRSSPTLDGSTVYIGTEKGKVYGVDAKIGTKVFECQSASANYTIETSPAIYDNKVYFGDWDGVFYVYDLTTAALVWKHDTKTDNRYSGWVNAIVTDPLIVNGYVYFGGRNCNLYCMDAKTGTRKWKWHDGGDMWMLGGPDITNGVLYIGSSYQHVVRAFNAETGTLLWTSPVVYRVNGKPMVYGDFVFAGTEGDTDEKLGDISIISAKTGRLLSKLNVSSQIYSSPLLSEGKVYFGSTNGNVYSINAEHATNLPIMDLKIKPQINMGIIEKNAAADTSFYVYNIGVAVDSISVTTTGIGVKITPSAFLLAPDDSQKVQIDIIPDSLTVKKYVVSVSFNSLHSIPVYTIKKAVLFEIINTTDVKGDKAEKIFSLSQNYPNPFNPETIINYEIPSASFVQLKVYDILGNEVSTLVSKEQQAGNYGVNFKSTGNSNNLSSGIYIYSLRAGNAIITKKMTLLR